MLIFTFTIRNDNFFKDALKADEKWDDGCLQLSSHSIVGFGLGLRLFMLFVRSVSQQKITWLESEIIL